MLLFYLTFVFVLVVVICKDSPPPTVTLPLGVVEGYVKKTVNGKEFNAFEGIPYASPPVGDLRFEKPVPVKPWTGIWKAKTIFRCIQYDHMTPEGQDMVSGDEDCLYVNIYTPKKQSSKKLNVLFYIHGGAFMFNHGGMFGPEIIMDRDVIYITINYRLGPLGFLSTEDNVVPGNNGMRDQILALKWMKDNIEYFGGNPDSITLMGMSAGGASVHTHFITPHSKGLFARGVSQSGCVLNPWVLMEEPLNHAKKVASLVGCPTESNEEMVNCLKTKPAKQIVNTVKQFQPWLYNPFSPFGLVVDSWAEDPVFPEHPFLLLQKGLVQDLPWMISYTSSEGLYPASDFYFDEYTDYLDKRWDSIMPYILHYHESVPKYQMDKVSQKIRNEYLKKTPVSRRDFAKFVKILSDRLFIKDIETAARLQSEATKSPVYSYYFNYRGAHSKSELRTHSNVDIGVSHADDTCYCLKVAKVDTLSTEDDRQMSKLMLDMLTSFMDTGKPNIDPDWKPLSKKPSDPWVQLHIAGPQKTFLEDKDHVGNKKFWDSLPIEENERLFTMKDEL
ncbi:venom carboxylesterase-6-like [Diabrotica undecimpunctata]|uniref:venom carboxylesterase-6-like n=1 Tax=Diabrotica undecimpunctata TaxID=50387 RepID=UPI003B63C39E